MTTLAPLTPPGVALDACARVATANRLLTRWIIEPGPAADAELWALLLLLDRAERDLEVLL